MPEFARDCAIVIGDFPQPKPRSLHIPIDDLSCAHNPIRNVVNDEATLAFYDYVLRGSCHRWRLNARGARSSPERTSFALPIP